MKTYLLAIASLIFVASCNNAAKNKVEGTDAQVAASGTGVELTVDPSASSIHWVGSKVGGGPSRNNRYKEWKPCC